MKCVCKEPFSIDVYDDNGFWTEKTTTVQKGEEYEVTESDFRLIGGDVRLDNDGSWLELSKERFERHFEIVEEEKDRAD